MAEIKSSRPKIAFVSQSKSWGGLEMNMVRYAGWMKARNWHVVIVCFEDSSIHKKAKAEHLHCACYPSSKNSFLQIGLAISSILKRENIGLIWFREKEIQKLLPLLKMRGNRISLYQQGMQLGKSKKDLLHRYLYRMIDIWLAPNKFMFQQVLEWTSMKKEHVEMIPLGMDVKSFEAKKYDRAEAKKNLDYESTDFLFGIIGRIDPLKNQLFALEAFHEIWKENPSAKLLLMGDKTYQESDSYYERIVRYISSNGLNNAVKLLPYRPEVEDFYSAVDIMIMPSVNESFGRVTLEGMTFGLPIIGSNSGGTAELLGYGKFGLVYEPESKKELIDKMKWVLEHPFETSAIGELASAEAKSSYSHEVVLDQCEVLIEKTWKRND